MGENSKIEWTHHTFNPWWGCVKISPGCTNCYAADQDLRYGGSKEGHWGLKAPRRMMSDAHWNGPVKWNKSAAFRDVRERVFCASMADVFEDRDDLVAPRARLFALIKATPALDWLLLTKRPENLERMLPWAPGQPCAWDAKGDPTHLNIGWAESWPNVWIGTTTENQEMLEERGGLLAKIPSVVKFFSYEPALEAVDFTNHLAFVDWIIAGSESGPHARPAQEDWYRSVRNQVAGTQVKFFYKQHIDTSASGKRKISLPVLDGKQWAEFPR